MGRGTGTTTLKDKMLQQMTATREAILCTILLELWKAYEVLDKYRCLDILTGHIVGTRALRLLRTYWDRLQMVTESGGYFRPPFKVYQGVTQGNTLYPIFSIWLWKL